MNAKTARRQVGTGLLILVATANGGCTENPAAKGKERITVDDPRLAALQPALKGLERTSKGFRPIPRDSELFLDGPSTLPAYAEYDEMLTIENDGVSNSVQFRKKGDGYEWKGETETYDGPNVYDFDGEEYPERLVISFDKDPKNGDPKNVLEVEYYGFNEEIRDLKSLDLDDARRIIKKWKRK